MVVISQGEIKPWLIKNIDPGVCPVHIRFLICCIGMSSDSRNRGGIMGNANMMYGMGEVVELMTWIGDPVPEGFTGHAAGLTFVIPIGAPEVRSLTFQIISELIEKSPDWGYVKAIQYAAPRLPEGTLVQSWGKWQDLQEAHREWSKEWSHYISCYSKFIGRESHMNWIPCGCRGCELFFIRNRYYPASGG